MYQKNTVASRWHKGSILIFCRWRATEISVQKSKGHHSVHAHVALYWLLIVGVSRVAQGCDASQQSLACTHICETHTHSRHGWELHCGICRFIATLWLPKYNISIFFLLFFCTFSSFFLFSFLFSTLYLCTIHCFIYYSGRHRCCEVWGQLSEKQLRCELLKWQGDEVACHCIQYTVLYSTVAGTYFQLWSGHYCMCIVGNLEQQW